MFLSAAVHTAMCNPEIRLNVGYPARGTSPFFRSLWTAGSSSHYLARRTPRAHPPRHTPIHTLKDTPHHIAPVCIDARPFTNSIEGLDATNPGDTVIYIPLSALAPDQKEIQNIQIIVSNFMIKIKSLQFISNVLRKMNNSLDITFRSNSNDCLWLLQRAKCLFHRER